MGNKGAVYWITGLSGAGKTTVAKQLFDYLKEYKDNVVLLDGDILREVFGNDLGYTNEDRKISAMRNSKLCKMLSDQGFDTIIATISMFDFCREWNREHIDKYLEIFLDVPIEVLIDRDQKQLYSKFTENSVVGISLECEMPRNPDLTIKNDGSIQPNEVASQIIKVSLYKGMI